MTAKTTIITRLIQFIYLILFPLGLVALDYMIGTSKPELVASWMEGDNMLKWDWLMLSIAFLFHFTVFFVVITMLKVIFAEFEIGYEWIIPLTILTAVYHIKQKELYICIPFIQISMKLKN